MRLVSLGPGAAGSGEVLPRHQNVGAMLFPADNARTLQLGSDCLVDLSAAELSDGTLRYLLWTATLGPSNRYWRFNQMPVPAGQLQGTIVA